MDEKYDAASSATTRLGLQNVRRAVFGVAPPEDAAGKDSPAQDLIPDPRTVTA